MTVALKTLLAAGRLPGRAAWMTILAGVILAWPTLQMLALTVWRTDEQGHGPLVVAAGVAVLASRASALAALSAQGARLGWLVLGMSLPLLVFARSQFLPTLEMLALIACLCALVLVAKGRAGLRECAFGLAFLLFAVPWPESLVVSLTQPLKTAVSMVSEAILHTAGYPIGRAGVTMTVGPYEVLVADACAGLNSMFVLEAITLLYIKLFGTGDRVRNVILAVLAMPIAFVANVLRVLVLVLLLFHLGDGVAQSFIHGFAGILLMSVALTLTFSADILLGGALLRWRRRNPAAST